MNLFDQLNRGNYGTILIALFLLFLLLYGIKLLVSKHKKRTAKFICSISKSVHKAIILNPDVQKIIKHYPRFFSFLKRRISRSSFLGLSLSLISIALLYIFFLFISLTQDILVSDQIVAIDHRIAQLFIYFRNPESIATFSWITLLGKWPVIVGLAILVSIILWIWRKKVYVAYLWLALATDEFLNYITKIIIHRPRPINPVYLKNSFSFPSGHAMISVVFYGFIAYLLIRHLKNWKQKISVFFIWLILALSIGLSRLYLGAHYFSDVWAGYLLGLLVLLTVITLFKWREVRKNNLNKNKNGIVLERQRKKIITVIIIVVGIAWYVGFASFYHPNKFESISPTIQNVSGDLLTYFSNHNIPRYSETIIGERQEPLGFIFLAKDDSSLVQDFEKSSWFLADGLNFRSTLKIAKDTTRNKEYLRGPITPSFWNGNIHNFGFQKPTNNNSVRQRHHIRIWKTNFKQEDYSVYVGIASLDEEIKWWVTHKIDPDIDTERDFVKISLENSGVIASSTEIQFVKPVLGLNFGRDSFFTNGKLFIIYLK